MSSNRLMEWRKWIGIRFWVCICTHDAGIPQVLKYKFNCAEEVNVE